MTREDKIAMFDVNGLSVHDQIYGLPFTIDESEIIVIPVPWEVTVSFGSGTIDGPSMLFDASKQVDLFSVDNPDFWERGVAVVEDPQHLRALSNKLRPLAEARIDAMENGDTPSNEDLLAIEKGCREMNEWVEHTANQFLDNGKFVALIGGDHSTPLGLIKALSKRHPSMGVLQIDAHADLRIAYEGFTYSHASIMYNVLHETSIKSLVQVGIRDYCHQEHDFIKSDARVTTFFDREIQHERFNGKTWADIVDDIVSQLPDTVYISLDVDGLQPVFCPNTGTPVYGGFTPDEVVFLVNKLSKSGKKIVGFDVNEVGANEWDANVAARVVWRFLSVLSL